MSSGTDDQPGDDRRRAGNGLGEVHDAVQAIERGLQHLPAHEIAVLAGGDRVGRLVERRVVLGVLDGTGSVAADVRWRRRRRTGRRRNRHRADHRQHANLRRFVMAQSYQAAVRVR